jgi:5'-deoxynucleotidase YfbR-like HD superfamily hydrolase
MLAIVAPAIAETFMPELDENLVARFAAVHDALEAYVGDTPTHEITPEDLVAKAEREAKGLAQFMQEYAAYPKFVALIEAYETQELPEARFVRMVDKLMPLLVHVNDGGVGLRRAGFTPEAIRQNARERADTYKAAYPDMAHIVDIRTELSNYVAGLLQQG